MKKIFSLYIVAILLSINSLTTLSAQTSEAIPWKTLADVTYIKKYDDFLGFKVDFPVFSENISAMADKEITIRGYIIPIEGYKSHKEFIFSAYPYDMCFFCGGAGPETVMEIEAKSPIKYSAEAITIRGVLKLNNEDINQLMYSLSDVVKIDE